MSIECVCQASLKASPQAGFAVLADVGRWPEWARDLERVVVHPHGPDGGPLRVTVVVEIFGEEFDGTVEIVPDPVNHAITFGLTECEHLQGMSGVLRFDPVGSGSRLDVKLSGTLTQPRGSRVDRLLSRRIETALTRDLVRYIERGRR
ncbi:SRPBCC family protein [Sporichthya sp.]|uniref:SRPBCC family protein n=1 Tax=Sporichthya sp. TaxID=65475 RepID=UPI00183D0092|nr:SRPBCC family protein [Sporichthya sp.]MBA3745505.1 SRPBCC family protein [Sporichthya sp.]